MAWSINTPAVSAREEWKTAKLDEKLDAARRCADHGFRVAFHFDPMIHYEGWQQDYEELVNTLFNRFQAFEIAWLSVGSLRFNKELKDVIRCRFPKSEILYGEIVRGTDGKYQYFKPIRVEMYARMIEWIRNRSLSSTVYLCMETQDVFQKVFDWTPSLKGDLGRYMDERVLVTIKGHPPEVTPRRGDV